MAVALIRLEYQFNMGEVKRYIGRQELWTNQAGCMGKLTE